MKIKTIELTDIALDWAAAESDGIDVRIPNVPNTYIHYLLSCINGEVGAYHPSTNWNQGGQIIDREGIEFSAIGFNSYRAHIFKTSFYGHGDTHLRAAMRCFVASRLGDEVDIPEELL